jgi:predicted dehydrogenase
VSARLFSGQQAVGREVRTRNTGKAAETFMQTVRIGVIGCGHWGPNHIRVFSQLRESKVLACADLAQKRLDAIGEQFPQVQRFQDYHQMLRETELDAVVVAAPTRAHFAIVKDALEAGKHVLCEKPICVTVEETETLDALARSKGLILMAGHVFLFNPGIVKLKELVHFHDPGRIHYMRALRTNLGPIRQDVNSVYDLATHDISIFNFLLDQLPESASAVGGTFLQDHVEDVAFISLRYPNGVLANIQVSWLDPKKLREIVVVGDKKMIVWDELASPGPISIYDKGVVREPYYDDYGQFHLLAREGDITIPKVKVEEPLKVQNRFFLESIKQGRMKMNDGQFAIGVAKVLEAVERSLRNQGAAARIPA